MSLAARVQLFEGGFAPVALEGKAAFMRGWQNAPTLADIVRWPNGNTGILTAHAPAIDIDVLDAKVAERIEALAFALAGATLVRVGRPPKRALLYRTEEPFQKLRSPRFEAGRVEVLGDGQQLAAFGVHPDTGRAYEWRPHPPRRRADLPPLSFETAREIVAEATRIMERAGWTAIQQARETREGVDPAHGPLMATAGTTELPKPLYLKVLRFVPLSEQVTRRDQRRVIGILNIALQRQHDRNDGLNIAGFCLRELIADGTISAAAAEELLLDVAALNGYVAKDGEAAARVTIRSGLGIGSH